MFNKCGVTEIDKFDAKDGEKENSSSMRHSTMGFISAWLISLYSSAGSCAFVVPMVHIGKVQGFLFQKLCYMKKQCADPPLSRAQTQNLIAGPCWSLARDVRQHQPG